MEWNGKETEETEWIKMQYKKLKTGKCMTDENRFLILMKNSSSVVNITLPKLDS